MRKSFISLIILFQLFPLFSVQMNSGMGDYLLADKGQEREQTHEESVVATENEELLIEKEETLEKTELNAKDAEEKISVDEPEEVEQEDSLDYEEPIEVEEKVTKEEQGEEEQEKAANEEFSPEIKESVVETVMDVSEEQTQENSERNEERQTGEDEVEEGTDQENNALIDHSNNDSEIENNEGFEEKNLSEQKEEDQQERIVQPLQTPGLADVSIFSRTSLSAAYEESNTGKEKIVLEYSGSTLLGLKGVSNTYTTFYLPPEIARVITAENVSATYNVPRLGFLSRNRGSFDSEDIILEGNQVYMSLSELLSLELLSRSYFTLTIELDELPPTRTGEYEFYSEATDGLVDLSLISGNPASATLSAPILEPPTIYDPVYDVETIVNGKGYPNATAIIRIGEEKYEGPTDSNGDFSVTIPKQEAGTVIHGSVRVNSNGQEFKSEETTVTVAEAPDSMKIRPPIINEVYSEDTVVTGRGKAGTTIHLTANGKTIEKNPEESTVVKEDGTFSVDILPQEPETVISVTLTNEERIESESSEVTVKEAILSFYNVPSTLIFETTEIGSGFRRIQRRNPNWSLEVRNTRRSGIDYSVQAKAEYPLRSLDSAHELPNALIFIDENSKSHSLLNQSIEVYQGVTGDKAITTISWDADRGPMVEADTDTVYAEPYETVITWTLVDAP